MLVWVQYVVLFGVGHEATAKEFTEADVQVSLKECNALKAVDARNTGVLGDQGLGAFFPPW
jgi:hypothetical protein